MNKIYNLDSFTGSDDRERFAAALEELRQNPGSTLIVPPGTYTISTPLAREAMEHVLHGDFGQNPEPVMFNPDYKYDRGLDFGGHKGTTVICPEGANLMIDGYMEPISIHDCEDVTVSGFTIDHVRRPYSRGILTYREHDGEDPVYDAYFPDEIYETMPTPRECIYVNNAFRYDPFQHTLDKKFIDAHHMEIKASHCTIGMTDDAPREIYFWHTFHSRPAVLIERAKNTHLSDITIHSSAGMGITAMHAENILIERLRVIPAVGEHMSTNTDATHFASCRGLLRIDSSEFEGQGDDTLNVHTYYYTPEVIGRRRVRLRVDAPTGTHTQSVDHPEAGDRLEIVNRKNLCVVSSMHALVVDVDFAARTCEVEVDADLPETLEGFLICDPDEVPETEFVNCHAHNHWARSILIKSRRALIENCTVTFVYDVAVKVAAEAWWYEGINTEDVTIRGCRFIGNGWRNGECGGISVTMDSDEREGSPHGRITITDNIIECPVSKLAIAVARAKELYLANNKLSSLGEEPVYVSPEVKVTYGYPED